MLGNPGWMMLAFAIGVFGGLADSILLLVRHRMAVPDRRRLCPSQ
jgi:hypothetical protein